MPRTTHQYGFEAKVCGWAAQTSERLMGGMRSFLLLFDSSGVGQVLYCEPGAPNFRALARDLEARREPHLFFDPLEDGKEYIWLSWRDVTRPVMERLTGATFDDEDFVSRKDGSRVEYQSTWGVMF